MRLENFAVYFGCDVLYDARMNGKKRKAPVKTAITAKDGQEVIALSDRPNSVKRDEAGHILPGSQLNPFGQGAGSIGQTILQYVTRMREWPRSQLTKVITDKDLPVDQLAAASWLLRVTSNKTTKAGTHIATAELQHLFDRTVGRPSQAMDIRVEHKETQTLTLLTAIQDE